jgi:hypothetical protein
MMTQAEPPLMRDQTVRTPEGFGRVTAFSQTQDGWLVGVLLDTGRYWLGLAPDVLDADHTAAREVSVESPLPKNPRR